MASTSRAEEADGLGGADNMNEEDNRPDEHADRGEEGSTDPEANRDDDDDDDDAPSAAASSANNDEVDDDETPSAVSAAPSATVDGRSEARTSDPADQDDDEDDQPSESKPAFHVRQRVYARDEKTGILYEAVVRRAMYGPRTKQLNILLVNPDDPHNSHDDDDGEEDECCWHYFVHYLGWNVKWDRWVEEESLYQDSEGAKTLAIKLKNELRNIVKMSKINGKRGEIEIAAVRRRMKQLEEERREEERKEELRKQGLLPPEEEKESEDMGKQESILDDQEKMEQDAQENQSNEEEKVVEKAEEDDSKRGPKKKLITKAALDKERKLRKRDLQGRRKQAHAEKLILPFTLKKVLVEEWEVVSLCGMVPCLPAPVTIKDALDRYLESKLEVLWPQPAESRENTANGDPNVSGGTSEQVSIQEVTSLVEEKKDESRAEEADDNGASNEDEERRKQEQEWIEMVEGIAQYFDEALSVHLLYKQEMPQHKLVMKSDDPSLQGKRKCELYGCEYLLRLFVQFPAFLAESDIPEPDARKILSKIGDLVRFLQKHQGEIFRQTYKKPKGKEVMPPEKLRIEQTAAKTDGPGEAAADDSDASEEEREEKRGKRRGRAQKTVAEKRAPSLSPTMVSSKRSKKVQA